MGNLQETKPLQTGSTTSHVDCQCVKGSVVNGEW